MFQSPEPLDLDKHVNLKLSSTPDYRFAAKEIVTPIVSGEMWHIAREYIMVFPKKIGLPLALLGTQAGVNAYLGDGNPPWWARYIPAHLRRYPFITAPKPGNYQENPDQQNFTVFVDSAAPQLSETEGQPLFSDDGQPTDVLKQIQTALLSLQQDFGITKALVRQIVESGLLVDQTLTIKPVDREPVALKGFRIIDQDKLRSARPELLAGLIKTRALDLIYAHICSLSNLQDGLLAKKAGGEMGQTPVPVPDLDALFGDNDDMIKFDF